MGLGFARPDGVSNKFKDPFVRSSEAETQNINNIKTSFNTPLSNLT
jgi:hypothetical protein